MAFAAARLGALILTVLTTLLTILQMPEGARRILFGLIVLFATAAHLRIVEERGVGREWLLWAERGLAASRLESSEADIQLLGGIDVISPKPTSPLALPALLSIAQLHLARLSRFSDRN